MMRFRNLSEKERTQMTLKRLLTPVLALGVFLALGSMSFAQIVCGLANTGPALAATNAAAPAGNAVLLALPGASANLTATGQTEPVGAGSFETPDDTSESTTALGGQTALGAGTAANRIPGGGGVRIVCQNNGAAATPGVVLLTVSFGVPITNTQSFPATASGVRVINGTGVFTTAGPSTGTVATAPAGANVGIAAVNNSSGTVTIALGTPVEGSAAIGGGTPNTSIAFGAGAAGSFDLVGVLVSAVGKTGGVTASLVSSPGVIVGSVPAIAGFTVASGATASVATAITAGIQDPSLVATGALPGAVFANCVAAGILGGCASGPATLATNGTATKNNFTIKVTENYPEFFKSANQFNGGGVGVFPAGQQSSVQLNVVLNNVPSGFLINNCNATLTDTTGTVARPGTPTITPNNSSGNTLTVIFTADTDLVDTDVLWVSCQAGAGSATLPLASTSITAQVQLAPTGAALSSTGTAITSLLTGNVPRYNAQLQPSSAIPVVVFPPTQTTLLIPFAVVAPGINTGIAIANTSTDVFGSANGGATPVAGTIVFTMYPQAGGTPLTATTASVASGSLYANNLSGILPSGTTSFTGYIFAQANFPNAHGSATIYDTSTGHAELSTPVLIVTGAAGGNVSISSTRTTPEGLLQ
jgi:hypothetical protein